MRCGTLTAYQAGCGCDACAEHHRRHLKAYRLDRHRGVERLVDAEPLRAHVAALQAGGMSFRAITLAAGWTSRNALASALGRARVAPSTMARVLAVQPTSDDRAGAFVDAVGSRRRLQALAAIGWPYRAVADQAGLDASTVLHVRSGRTPMVRQSTAEAITVMYDRIAMSPGPSARAAAAATRAGWPPPLAWDDDTLDNPHFAPTRATRTRGDDHAACVDDVLELIAYGERDVDQIAGRLGIGRTYLDRLLRDFVKPYRATIDPHPVRAYADGVGMDLPERAVGPRLPYIAWAVYLVAHRDLTVDAAA